MHASRPRRLLFFAYYFPPLGGAGSQRALSFARHLPELGWEIVVVTPREGVYGLDSSSLLPDLPGVRVVRTGTFEPAVLFRRLLGRGRSRSGGDAGAGDYVEEVELGTMGRAIRRWVRRRLYFPDPSRGWVRSAVAAARKAHRESPVAAVLSSSPPVSCHVAAMRFAEAAGLPWVADWRDLWREHMDEADPRYGDAGVLEGRILGAASGLAAATESLGEILVAKGPRGPVRAVRNGFEPEDFAAPALPARAGGVFRILYAGTVYAPEVQSLDSFFEAVAGRNGGPGGGEGIRVRFLGKVHPGALEAAGASGLRDFLEVRGFVPHAEAVAEMRQADLLLLMTTLRRGRAGLVEVPAKTYEYLAARRPILVLTEEGSEAQRVLRGLPGVWCREPRDTDGIRAALREAMAFRPVPLPPWDGLTSFSRGSQARVLAGLLDEVAGARTEGRP